MASVYSTNESFACPFDPYCLGTCSWTGCHGNADVATPASWPHAQLERPPSCANEPHPSTATTSRLPSLARRSCPSWQILWMKDLLQPRQPGKTTAWALNDFQQWMAIIIVTLLHAVHVYRYYVYQLFYYNETAIQHLMTSCMPEGRKYKLYFPLYPSGRENILVIPRLV